jgi:hypothetical protein
MTDNVKLAAIDGTDALAFVIIRPGQTEGGVAIEAAANGMDKAQAAYVLRHVADQFDADTPSGQSSVDPRAAAAVLDVLAGRWEQMAKSTDNSCTDVNPDAEPGLVWLRTSRAQTYRRAAADLREVLASGRIPHGLMTDTELGG